MFDNQRNNFSSFDIINAAVGFLIQNTKRIEDFSFALSRSYDFFAAYCTYWIRTVLLSQSNSPSHSNSPHNQTGCINEFKDWCGLFTMLGCCALVAFILLSIAFSIVIKDASGEFLKTILIIGALFSTILLYLFGRLMLVLVGPVADVPHDLAWSWQRTSGYGIKIFLAAIGMLLLFPLSYALTGKGKSFLSVSIKTVMLIMASICIVATPTCLIMLISTVIAGKLSLLSAVTGVISVGMITIFGTFGFHAIKHYGTVMLSVFVATAYILICGKPAASSWARHAAGYEKPAIGF